MDQILITDLRFSGTHGALPEEQERPQPFAVDLTVETDLSVASRSDNLADTVDYRPLIDIVRQVVENEQHQLLERMAGRIAELALELPKVHGVTVTVRKLEPPIKHDIAHTAVRIHRP